MATRKWIRFARPQFIAAAIIAAGFAATITVNWPGHLEFDSIRQLIEGQTRIYSNWHPPIMSWMLGLANAIGPDAAPFIVFDATLAFGALLSLLWQGERAPWFAVIVAALLVPLPQLFLFQAIVWKDILFADANLAAFACLALAARFWAKPSWRLALLGSSIVFAALAALTRQNGIVIVPAACLSVAAIAATAGDLRRGLFLAAGYAVTCAALIFAANAALHLRTTTALGPVEQMEDLQLYDIGGMLTRMPDLNLPILASERPVLAARLNAKRSLYTPVGHDRLTDDPVIHGQITASVDPVGRQWRALVGSHPWLYLAVRAEDFRWLFLSTHPDKCLTYAVGVISLPADMRRAHVTYRYDDRDDWLDEAYARPLLGTPIFSHPVFAAAGLACLAFLIWRRRPADLAIAGLLLATLLYALSYFVIAIACQYRYLYAIDLSAIAAIFYVAVDPRRGPVSL